MVDFIINNKKAIIAGIAVVLFTLFVIAIYGKWTDIWYAFGKNLYHFLKK